MRRRKPWGVRVRAALATGLLLGLGATSSLAAWTGREHTSAAFEAATLPRPTLTQECEFVFAGLLGTRSHVDIYWSIPEEYGLEDVELEARASGIGAVLAPITGFDLDSSTTSLGGGTYRTQIVANLLTGLLGLGDELEVAIYLEPQGAGTWTSEPAMVVSNAGLLSLNSYCRNLT